MRSDIEWKKWGQVDPLFSGAPWPGQKNLPDKHGRKKRFLP